MSFQDDSATSNTHGGTGLHRTALLSLPGSEQQPDSQATKSSAGQQKEKTQRYHLQI